MVTTERKSKEERREEILNAALAVFAEHGLDGSSTEDVARRAGISQPYVFRLFGTKKDLFTAVIARCFRQTLEQFQRAAEGKRGEDALQAIGEAYGQLLATDRVYLRSQMQAYAACEDPQIREVVRGLRRPRRLRRARLRRGPGHHLGLLRQGDADERPLVHAPRQPDRALGAAPARGLHEQLAALFFRRR